MPPIKTVALAGASGTLGTPMLHALLAADFTVSVLTRHSSTATFPPTCKVTRVNYESHSELVSALQGQDAIVCTVTTGSVPIQKILIDAAIAAGVSRFIPGEFGCDCSLEGVQALPMYHEKIAVGKYLEERCAEEKVHMTWTAVYTNCFLDWGIDYKFYLDLEKKVMKLWDGGNFKTTTSPTDWVGKAVVAILRHEEETRNREVRVQGATVSQLEMLEIAKKYVGNGGWQVEEVSTKEMLDNAMKTFKENPSDVWGWLFGMLISGVFGEGNSRDFEGKNDNKMLGLEELGKDEVDAYFERAVKTGKAGVQY